MTVIPLAAPVQTASRQCRYCGNRGPELIAATDHLALLRCPACELHWLEDENPKTRVLARVSGASPRR